MIQYPPDFSGLSEWQQRLAQAVVPLTGHTMWPRIDLEHDFLTSGFVVEAGEHWFWVTAEHSIEELEKFTAAHARSTLLLRPSGDKHNVGVPFALPSIDKTFLSKRMVEGALAEAAEELPAEAKSMMNQLAKMDVAFIHLDKLYSDSLRQTGVVPFAAKDVWQNLNADEAQSMIKEGGVAFFISGVPATSVQFTEDGGLKTWAVKLLNIIYDSTELPNIVFRPVYPKEHHSGTMKGMSGGPAVAVKVTTGEVYWFGVQSGERRNGDSVSKLIISPAEFAYEVMVGMTAQEELD